MRDFCVYAHLTTDLFKIFYIGKGRIDRPYSYSNRTKFWRHEAAKHGLEVLILDTGLTNDEAKNLESRYIRSIGRRNLGNGPLVNLTDGGDGMHGFVLSSIHRAKIASAIRRKWKNPEYRLQAQKRASEASVHLWESDAYREKQSKAQTGKKRTDASRKLMSEVQSFLAKNPTLIEIRSSITKKRWADPEYRSHMANLAKERWQDPKFREMASARMKGSRKKKI